VAAGKPLSPPRQHNKAPKFVSRNNTEALHSGFNVTTGNLSLNTMLRVNEIQETLNVTIRKHDAMKVQACDSKEAHDFAGDPLEDS